MVFAPRRVDGSADYTIGRRDPLRPAYGRRGGSSPAVMEAYAMEAASAKALWRLRTGYVLSSPAVADGGTLCRQLGWLRVRHHSGTAGSLGCFWPRRKTDSLRRLGQSFRT
jgi:hypothetical protein